MNNLITYIAQVFIKMIKCALHFSNKSMKKTKQNKTKQHKKTKNYKPIYNKQNNKNIYTSAIKI